MRPAWWKAWVTRGPAIWLYWAKRSQCALAPASTTPLFGLHIPVIRPVAGPTGGAAGTTQFVRRCTTRKQPQVGATRSSNRRG
jgi:hypothetical protein